MKKYWIEHNGDCWQSVFPRSEAHKSMLHTTIKDARQYMVKECGVRPSQITVIKRIKGGDRK